MLGTGHYQRYTVFNSSLLNPDYSMCNKRFKQSKLA
jgi:hypothetical protein